jgi:pyridine nucleotide-disulfide oxidoreductase domain-containing protein 1
VNVGQCALMETDCDVLVVGGGIAGVSCASEVRRLAPGARVLLLSASQSLRGVRTIAHVTRTVEELDVVVRPLNFLELEDERAGLKGPGWIRCRFGLVASIDDRARSVALQDGTRVSYAHSCAVCTGAVPKPLMVRKKDVLVELEHPSVHLVRDTASVLSLGRTVAAAMRRTEGPARVVVIGAGAIGCEVALSLASVCEVAWVVRSGYVGRSMLDATASQFLLDIAASHPWTVSDEELSTVDVTAGSSEACGNAVGPRWTELLMSQIPPGGTAPSTLAPITGAHVCAVRWEACDWLCVDGEDVPGPVESAEARSAYPLECLLRHEDGSFSVVPCDAIVPAIGVSPNLPALPRHLRLSEHDGGLLVDKRMMVRGSDSLFAAGDAASMEWSPDDAEIDVGGPHWLQMRLWTQAKVTGSYCGARISSLLPEAVRGARALSDLELEGGYNMEMFGHCTSLVGKKIVLLARFNGQGLDKEYEEAIRSHQARLEPPASSSAEAASAEGASAPHRVSIQIQCLPKESYVKLVLLEGRVIGAVLVGETELEEAVEKLIWGGQQVGHLDLLDPELDIDAMLD